MNLAYGGRSIQVQDGEACMFLEEGTSTCCTRSSVGRGEDRLLEVEDFGRRQALGGGDWHDGEGCTFLEEGTSCCGTRPSVGGEDRHMELVDSCRKRPALGGGDWLREESKSRRRRQASG